MLRSGEEEWTDRFRGLLLGLALGDAFERSRGALPTRGAIEAGVGTQLAAFMTDGLVRALIVSGPEPARGDIAPALWSALQRWGARQGLIPTHDAPGSISANGWLNNVGVLGERRGSAPATVSALQGRRPGTTDLPATTSRGTQVVIRLLPTAAVRHLLPYDGSYGQADAEFASYAALTHGEGGSIHSAVATAKTAAWCLDGMDVVESVGASRLGSMGSVFGAARDLGVSRPRHPSTLSAWMDDSATSAMAGGIYTAISFPDPEDLEAALDFAHRMPGSRGAATVAAALHGAVHGVHGLPVGPTSRLELAWVLDQLARDLSQQLGGRANGPERYPV